MKTEYRPPKSAIQSLRIYPEKPDIPTGRRCSGKEVRFIQQGRLIQLGDMQVAYTVNRLIDDGQVLLIAVPGEVIREMDDGRLCVRPISRRQRQEVETAIRCREFNQLDANAGLTDGACDKPCPIHFWVRD